MWEATIMKLKLEFVGPEEELEVIRRTAIEMGKRLNNDGFWDADDETSRPKKLDDPRYNIEWDYEWEDGE